MPTAKNEHVGIVGVGRMGLAMLKHLVKHGHQVTACDLDETQLAKAREAGAATAKTPAEVARAAHFVIIGVGYDDEVNAVVLGTDGLLAALAPGAIIAVSSTAKPDTVKALDRQAQSRGIDVLDAPICRGRFAADAGTLLALVGGKPEVMERGRAIYGCFCSDYAHLGDVGHGQVGKTMNNLLLWINAVGLMEAGRLAETTGIDLAKLRAAASDALKEWDMISFTGRSRICRSSPTSPTRLVCRCPSPAQSRSWSRTRAASRRPARRSGRDLLSRAVPRGDRAHHSIRRPGRISRPAAGAQRRLHMRRQRRADVDRRALLVERNHDLARMQVKAAAPRARRAAVDAVPENRPSLGGAMHAQLMGAAGKRLERQPGQIMRLPSRIDCSIPRDIGNGRFGHRRPGRAPQYRPCRRRRLAGGIVLHPPAARRVLAAERQLDATLLLTRPPRHHGPIGLADAAGLEQVPELGQGLAMAAKHEAAGGVAVEPMRQRGCARQPEAQRAEIVLEAFAPLRPLVYGEARRLVDDQHQGVAVEHASDYLFRGHAEIAITSAQ